MQAHRQRGELADGVLRALLAVGVALAQHRCDDLLRDVLEALDRRLEAVRITELTDGVFYALLVFDGGVEVSARPSDAIALALRTGTTIHCADSVLEEAGIAVPDEQEDEVEKFREFLDQISPDDFLGGGAAPEDR